MGGENLMRLHLRHLGRAGGIGFGLVGFGLLTCGLFWPASVEQLFRSRLGVVLLGIWCIGSRKGVKPLLCSFALDRPRCGGQSQAMPRQLRIQYPGAMYHVMSRGNRRQDIYLDVKGSTHSMGCF